MAPRKKSADKTVAAERRKAYMKEYMKRRRADPQYNSNEERRRNTLAHKHARQNIAQQCQAVNPWMNVVTNFNKLIRLGPTEICDCCGSLWFQRSIKSVSRLVLEAKQSGEFLAKILYCNSRDGDAHFCHTCLADISKGNVPRLAISNGLNYATVAPEISNLTSLEVRLVSARHVFQKIWSVYGNTGQMRTKGRIINVPVSVDTTVNLLPRMPSTDYVIHLRVGRQMNVDHNYTAGNIRPACVMRAARKLCELPLYQEHGIALITEWETDIENLLTQLTYENHEEESHTQPDQNDVNPGGIETLITGEEGIRICPAEGNKPVSILFDIDSQYLAFPQIFGGYKLNPKYIDKRGRAISLSRHDIVKSMARRYDRRAVECVEHLLYMAKSLEIQKIMNNFSTCLRKRRHNGDIAVTVGQLCDSSFVDGLVRDDNAYRILQGVRNSAHHWHQEGLKVRAMVRQFGLPNLFVTISAAEARWNELLVILKLTADREHISENQAEEMTGNEKARLIQRDPVTCARYFDYRLSLLIKTWESPQGPFGNRKIIHFYYRIEFQQRGSPHAHMLLWLQDAPTYEAIDPVNEEEVIKFIDEIITCTSDYPDSQANPIHQLNNHRHTHTCRKKTGIKCRFGIPFLPMDKTRILKPLEDDHQELKHLKEKFRAIRQFLESFSHESPPLMNFEVFLSSIKCSLDEYLFAIRSSLKKNKLYYKRQPCDVFINPYSEKIIRLQRSNMDIQFVLDVYALCCYLVDYINKCDRGLSDLLIKIIEDVKKGNKPLKECLRAVGSAFHGNSELSAQEAAYNCLQIPMSMSSESSIFIQTGPLEERNRILKSHKELMEMDPDSNDIFVYGLLEHYSDRPDSLEGLNLAQFSAWYEFSKIAKGAAVPNEGIEVSEDDNSSHFLPLKTKPGFLKKRTRPKVIRFRRFNAMKEESHYYHELLMLYIPWRNEQEELINCKQRVLSLMTIITANRKEFNHFDDDFLDLQMQQAEETRDSRIGGEEDDQNRPSRDKFKQYQFQCGHGSNENEFGVYEKRPFMEKFPAPNRVTEEEFEKMLTSLNAEQRDFVTHIIGHFKTSTNPIYTYLKGGAGVGKSTVIKTLYQALLRVFNSFAGDNPDQPPIILTAPTGKAAFNIFGTTLHTAFQLPINCKEATELSADVANSMAFVFSRLRVVVIDEISMVGEHILRMVDKRLRDIFDKTRIFGGISIIAVGDFYQLRPVLASALFLSRCNDPIAELLNVPLWHNFNVHQLNTIMRQRDDKLFAIALNNMAAGTMTDEDCALIETRTFSSVPAEVQIKRPIHLFYTNSDVNDYNNLVLSLMPGPQANSLSSDIVSGVGNEAGRKAILSCVQRNNISLSETMGLARNLFLKVGARYVVTCNVDISDGRVNGVIGILRKIDMGIHVNNPQQVKPLRVWIEFENERTGRHLRAKQRQMMQNLEINPLWTPVEPHTEIIKRRQNCSLQVIRKQFPLTPAEAMTIHKSQGSTYESVVVHLKGIRERALLYVACSRATTSAGLFLIGVFKKTSPPSKTDPLYLEMARHSSIRLTPMYLHLKNRSKGQLLLMFHNVQSLHRHWKLYENDDIFMNSDFLLMAETWTFPSELVTLKSHSLIASIDCANRRHAIGSRCYTLHRSNIVSTFQKYAFDEHGSVSVSAMTFRDIRIISVYRSPKCSLSTLMCTVEEAYSITNGSRTLMGGDFNVNLLNGDGDRLRSEFARFGLLCVSPLEATTKHGTKLDAIFSDFRVDSSGTYTSMNSIHEPLWVKFCT